MMTSDTHTLAAEPAAASRPPEELCTLNECEAQHIARALDVARGNQRRAARLLGITRWALARRVRKHGLVVRLAAG